MHVDSDFPPIPLALVEAVERLFPDRAPDLGTPDAQVWHAAGAANVAAFLRQTWERQQKAAVRGMKPLNAAPADLNFLD